MDSIVNWLSSFQLNQEMLFIAFVMITTVLLVMTIGYVVIGVNSPLKRKLAQITTGEKVTTPAKNTKMLNTWNRWHH